MNRAQRRQAAKEFQAQLRSGAVPDLAELANRPKAITLAFPTRGPISIEFHRAVIQVLARAPQFGFAARIRDCEHDGNVARAKNLLLKSFLETEDDYLLFTDTNIAFAPQDVAMLIAADSPIAGALYFTAATGSEAWPVAWVEDPRDEDRTGDTDVDASGDSRTRPVAYAPVSLPKPPEDFDETDQEQLEAWMATLSLPIPVAGVGFGLSLLTRDTAQAMADNYEWPFEVCQDQDEDLQFCLRAAALGLQTVVMPAARVGNMRLGMV